MSIPFLSFFEAPIMLAGYDTSSAQDRHNFLGKLAPLMQSAQGDLQTLIDLMSTKLDVRFQNLDVDLQQEISSMFKRYQDHHHSSSRPEVLPGRPNFYY